MTHPPGLPIPGLLKLGTLKYRIALAIAFLSLVAILGSQPSPREQVGPLPGGAFLLNSGWKLDPVGQQAPLDTLPMSSALSPDGKYLLVLNGGVKPPTGPASRDTPPPTGRGRAPPRAGPGHLFPTQ